MHRLTINHSIESRGLCVYVCCFLGILVFLSEAYERLLHRLVVLTGNGNHRLVLSIDVEYKQSTVDQQTCLRIS